jgi:dTDP-4-amino-4,6-dideoxygalactose transaminase
VSTEAARSVDVPFLDLEKMHAPLRDAFLEAFAELLETGRFTSGPAVAEFEAAFAAWCGVRHCVGTGSGLDALRFALTAAGLQPEEEVVLPAMTFVATAEAVTQAGGRPVLADISERDWNLDVAGARAALTSKTRFLLPVHLYGQLADMHELRSLAEAHGLSIVEDACQAHGAERDGVRAGTVGVASAFSFYPGKNLGAMGDAGALVTDDPSLCDEVRCLREHGQRRKYHHDIEGWTSRLDTIQAAALLLKLPRLEQWNKERQDIAARYTEALEETGDLRLPPTPAGSVPVWHLYVVRTEQPERLAESLAGRGISTGRHYPVPVHLTQAYAKLGYQAGDFPVAEALAAECLSLPIFPGMTDGQVDAVVEAVREHFARGR